MKAIQSWLFSSWIGRVRFVERTIALVPLDTRPHRQKILKRGLVKLRVHFREIPILEERQKRDLDTRDLLLAEGDADDRGCDRFRDRLERVDVTSLVVGMPVGMQVVELVHRRGIAASLAAAERTLLPAADRAIVASVALVDDEVAAADDEHSVDVAVDAALDISIELGESGGVDPLR